MHVLQDLRQLSAIEMINRTSCRRQLKSLAEKRRNRRMRASFVRFSRSPPLRYRGVLFFHNLISVSYFFSELVYSVDHNGIRQKQERSSAAQLCRRDGSPLRFQPVQRERLGRCRLVTPSASSNRADKYLVTGGGTGLGLITATALSENGCKVYITGRRLEPLQAAARDEKDGKGAIVPIQADVSTKEGITSVSTLAW